MASYLEQMQKHFLTHSRTRDYQTHSSKVHTVAWNCEGKKLASGSFDKTVCTFTLDRDRLSKDHTFRGHGDSVDQLRWHPSHPDLFVTASGDKTVRIWDARASKPAAIIATKEVCGGQPCLQLQLHSYRERDIKADAWHICALSGMLRHVHKMSDIPGENINICWSPDGQTIAVGNKDDLVTFIDFKSHKIKGDRQFKVEVNEIAWNKTGDLFFLTNGQGSIVILSYPDLKMSYSLNAHPANCICIEMDPLGKYFATGSADALVSLWDIQDLVCVRVFSRLEWPVRALSFSHDGKMLASASEDLVIDIADVETGEKITAVQCESPTFTVAWNPRKPLLAFSCDDKYERDRDGGAVKLFGISSES